MVWGEGLGGFIAVVEENCPSSISSRACLCVSWKGLGLWQEGADLM